MNKAKNYRDEYEPLGGLREDKVLEMQELMSTGIFKVIISNPKDIEFKIRPGYDYVGVFDRGDFMCYVTKEQAMEFIDDQSKLNQTIKQHFDYHTQEDEVERKDVDVEHKYNKEENIDNIYNGD